MLLIWGLTWILQSDHVVAAEQVWHSFGQHPVLTFLMILFLG